MGALLSNLNIANVERDILVRDRYGTDSFVSSRYSRILSFVSDCLSLLYYLCVFLSILCLKENHKFPDVSAVNTLRPVYFYACSYVHCCCSYI